MNIKDFKSVNSINQALYDLDKVYDMFDDLEVGINGLIIEDITYIENTIKNQR